MSDQPPKKVRQQGVLAEGDHGLVEGSDKRVSGPIAPPINEGDNQILLALRTASAPGECHSLEIAEGQTGFKAVAFDKQGRPTEIAFKDDKGGSTTFKEITYAKGDGNEVSSFIKVASITDPNNLNKGDWAFKLEKNKGGGWDISTPGEKPNSWDLDPERKRDFGRVTIQYDAKANQAELHGTGFDIARLTEGAKNDGFMSEQALKDKDPLSERMATVMAIKELSQMDGFRDSYSKEQLGEALARKIADSKLPQSNADGINTDKAKMFARGFEKLIADFDKTFAGKKEISYGDLQDHANRLRDGAVAQVAANSITDYGKVSYPSELLIANILEGTSLLRPDEITRADGTTGSKYPDEVAKVEKSINEQLQALGGSARKYSAEFAPKLVEAKFGDNEGEIAFAADRVLNFFNNGKPAGQVRIRQTTNVREQ